MTDGDTVLITGPLYHNAPFLLSTCALVLGGHVVLMSRFDAESALQLVEEHAVDSLYAVPTMMGRIWRLPEEQRLGYDVSSLRVGHAHGRAVPPVAEASLDGLARPGPGVGAVRRDRGAGGRRSSPGPSGCRTPAVWDAPSWAEMQVRDPAGAPLPPGDRRDLDAPRLGRARPYRYLGAEARTAGDGWESVGDMGSMDVEGYVYLADRTSDMLIVGGANVYPAEVESALREHPEVGTAVVIGLPHEDLGQVPHALLELEGEVTDEELRAHLAERLVSYKIPRSFERVSEPLRDDAGKVRRSALAAARA